MYDYVALKDYNFSSIESKRIRTIGYKADHNTPCKHFYDAYPLNIVFENEAYKGLYIALIEKSYQDGGNDYNGGFYDVFNDIGNDLYMSLHIGFYGNHDIESMRETADRITAYIGHTGFVKYIQYCMDKGFLVRNPELVALAMIGEQELAAKLSKEKAIIIEQREQEHRQRMEQYRQEQEEKKHRIEAEHNKAMQEAEEKIRKRETTANTDGIILDLMRKYNINVPLRTQGWILNRLAAVTFNGDAVGYQFYKTKNGKGSQTVFDCLWKLREAIDKAA